MNPYLDLYLTFARIGVCTFGGGYAMLPILQREVVENRRWTTEDELMDYYAIGQCTPGVIAVNTATFIGYKTHGILGGIAATAGMITPSLIIITIIAAFIQRLRISLSCSTRLPESASRSARSCCSPCGKWRKRALLTCRPALSCSLRSRLSPSSAYRRL